MTAPRQRSGSPAAEERAAKKQKVAAPEFSAGPAIHLPDAQPLSETYKSNRPYKHISVPGLFEDSLLEGVVSESKNYGVRYEEGSMQGLSLIHI